MVRAGAQRSDYKNKRDNYEETIFTICNVEPLLDGYGADNGWLVARESYERAAGRRGPYAYV